MKPYGPDDQRMEIKRSETQQHFRNSVTTSLAARLHWLQNPLSNLHYRQNRPMTPGEWVTQGLHGPTKLHVEAKVSGLCAKMKKAAVSLSQSEK